jgi:murein DD-endopeptidase MepM/ murein hydrolase activator NlpD
MPNPLSFSLGGSVGRASKGAANHSADVETVQNMLRLATMIEHNPQLDPGATDGAIDADESSDDTIKAIEAFQARFMHAPDGVIGVGKHTWQELMKVLEGNESHEAPATGASPATPNGDPCFFPFTQLPELNWTESIRRFGAQRSGGARAHAACDLYFPVGTTIHAITSGTVRADPREFYHQTDALEIDHGSFVARYGEIKKGSSTLRKGDRVTPGQPIAQVGKLQGMTHSMLHLELYDKSAEGQLTVTNNQTKRDAHGIPYMRRRDLIDPTEKLNEWKNNLPS